MSVSQAEHPLYLDTARHPVFAVYHPPASDDRRDTSVLFCPPFGWEDLCSYRSRRAWANHLARNGYPALRIDLPGTGDSGGSPRDPSLLDAWRDAIRMATDWLQDDSGCARVCGIGIGLGGLLVVDAKARGVELDELVLWAAQARGKRLLRELRAFAKLNATKDPDFPDVVERPPEDDPEPDDGSLVAGGFLMSAETVAAVESIDLTTVELPVAGGRALMLERDGISVDGPLRERLEESGADLTVAPGPGYTEMMAIPQESTPPIGVFETVSEWLDAGSSRAEATAQRELPANPHAELEVDGARITETPISVDRSGGALPGVLAEPVGTDTRPDFCAVFLNAGAIRRVGAGRMWVDASRRWAAGGVPSLRIDLEAIGDAPGEATKYRSWKYLYVADLTDQVGAVLDALDRPGAPRRFVLVGLCSGAYWAFHAARNDARAAASFLLNVRGLYFDQDLMEARDARLARRSVKRILTGSRDSWRRLVRGEISWSRFVEVVRGMVTGLRRGRRLSRVAAGDRRLDGWLDEMRADEKEVLFLFGENEPYRDELEASGFFGRIGRWPNAELRFLGTSDHTLRPLAAQRAAHAVIDASLARLRDRQERSSSTSSGIPVER